MLYLSEEILMFSSHYRVRSPTKCRKNDNTFNNAQTFETLLHFRRYLNQCYNPVDNDNGKWRVQRTFLRNCSILVPAITSQKLLRYNDNPHKWFKQRRIVGSYVTLFDRLDTCPSVPPLPPTPWTKDSLTRKIDRRKRE